MSENTMPYDPHTKRGYYLQDPYHDVAHDAFRLRGKLRDGSSCKSCGIVFHQGLMRWAADVADHECLSTHERASAWRCRDYSRDVLSSARGGDT